MAVLSIFLLWHFFFIFSQAEDRKNHKRAGLWHFWMLDFVLFRVGLFLVFIHLLLLVALASRQKTAIGYDDVTHVHDDVTYIRTFTYGYRAGKRLP